MRVIRLYDPEQCGADNPFFVTRVVVPNRRFFEFLERLDLAEDVPFPKGTRMYTVQGLDPVQLQEVFDIVGLQDTLNIFFNESVAVFELFTTDKTSAVNVRLGDDVFVTESFQLSRNVGYTLPLFGDIVSLAEGFVYQLSDNRSDNLIDSISIAEGFSISSGAFRQLFFLDSLSVSDTLNVRDTSNTNVGATESLSIGELWEFFRFRVSSLCTNYRRDLEAIGGQVHNFSELCRNLNALNANVRPPQEVLNAFSDFLSLVETFSVERSRGFGNEFASMVTVAELFAFRAETARAINNLVDQVSLNESFSLGRAQHYSQLLSSVVTIAEEFVFSRNIELLQNLQDFVQIAEEYSFNRSTKFGVTLQDGVALAEIFNFSGNLSFTRILSDQVLPQDVFSLVGLKNVSNGFTESLTLGETWDLFQFGPSVLCTSYREQLEAIGGQVHDYPALCGNLNALNTNVRPPQQKMQSYQEIIELAETFDFNRTAQFTRDLSERIDLGDVLNVVRTNNLTNNALDQLTLSEIFTILGQTDKVYSLFFKEGVSLLEDRDLRDIRKPSARLLIFVDGVNLIEGNN